MITERLMGVGRWDLTLSPDTPQQVLARLNPRTPGVGFAHIVITSTAIDPETVSDAELLGIARYVGVYREQPDDFEMAGCGVNMWMGDEDGKGPFHSSITTPSTFAQWVTALRPSYLTAGTVSTISGTYDNDYANVNTRKPLDDVCNRFGAEWRVTNDFKLDIGLQADLFTTTPKAVIVRKTADGGRELNVRGIPGEMRLERDLNDWARRVRFLSGSGPTVTSADGSVADADVAYRAPNGSAIQMEKIVTAPSTVPSGSESALAQAEFNEVKTIRQELSLTADAYDIGADVRVGDNVHVYDPRRGLFDDTQNVDYRGQVINPEVIRCVGYTWAVRRGMGVYLRHHVDNNTSSWDVEWIDLTNYFVPEDGTATVEVGAKPRPTS